MNSSICRDRSAGIIGNFLEHYDDALFGFLSPFIAPLFFEGKDPITALILIYSMLPLGFITRPLGSLIFGWIGDRFCRKQALFLFLTGMETLTHFLSNLRLAENLDLIHLPKMTRMAIGQCSLIRLATDISCLFYRLLAISEGIRTGKLWQVAMSVSKIFTVTFSFILRILNTRVVFFLLVLTGVSILSDLGSLDKKENWV